MARIGILALQGGFAAHARALADLGHQALEVRAAGDLCGLDGLILPGGESTAQLRLIDRHRLDVALREFASSRRPILATCAGLILAARHVTDPEQRSFGWINATVARNAWGRQLDSFEATEDRSTSAPPEACPLPLVFIRAPRIVGTGPEVEVLATFAGEPILIRQRNVIGATFHPELTRDRRVHRASFGECSSGKERQRPGISDSLIRLSAAGAGRGNALKPDGKKLTSEKRSG